MDNEVASTRTLQYRKAAMVKAVVDSGRIDSTVVSLCRNTGMDLKKQIMEKLPGPKMETATCLAMFLEERMSYRHLNNVKK